MPLRDFLVPEEQIKIICKRDVEYANKKYSLFVTNKRILLYKKRGILNKTEDVISESLEKIKDLEYKEKIGLPSLAKISFKGGLKINIKGPSAELRNIYDVILALLSIGKTINIIDDMSTQIRQTIGDKSDNKERVESSISQEKVIESLTKESTDSEFNIVEKLAKLHPEEHLFIKTLEQSMQNHFNIWSQVYPQLSLQADEINKVKLEIRINNIIKDMCSDYNKLKSFLKEINIDLDARYRHISFFCRNF